MSIINYIIAYSPIFLSHVAIPPLSYLSRKEQIPIEIKELLELIYSIIPDYIFNYNFVYNLTFNSNEKDPGLTRLTYMFVHINYNHLFSNLFTSFCMGKTIYSKVIFKKNMSINKRLNYVYFE